jgi:hypothetical protein
MRFTGTFVGIAAAGCLAASPALAGSHGHSTAPSMHVTGPKSATPPRTPSTTTTKTASGATAKTSTGARNQTNPTMLNPIAAKISAKPQLNAKITAMLPKDMTLDHASSGFKNQGQFIAALHVSRNAGIPFKDLKSDMTGKHMSLGRSIQDLKKTAAPEREAKRGEREANEDLKVRTSGHSSEHKSEHSIAQRIASRPQLSAKVQALLPSGMTVSQAAKGFTSERQFLSALHAAKDLNIPFAQIKAEMTGHDHDSLTHAIAELKPAADATTAARTAQQEAAADIKSTSTPAADGDAR